MTCFNPLLSGAQVSTDPQRPAAGGPAAGFNPLLSGAQVSTVEHQGQIARVRVAFQSPTKRGSGLN